MANWRIFFQCKPGNHWRACSDVKSAPNKTQAVAAVKNDDYQMPIRGPYVAKVTSDPLGTCWRPQTWREYGTQLESA